MQRNEECTGKFHSNFRSYQIRFHRSLSTPQVATNNTIFLHTLLEPAV